MAVNNRAIEVTTTPVPADVTVEANDFRASVNGASRVITSYTNINTTTHQLQLATPVFAVGDAIRIDSFQDVGGSAN